MNDTQNSVLETYRKAKKIKWIIGLLGSSTGLFILGAIFFLVIAIGIVAESNRSSDINWGNANLPEVVLRWKPMVEKECIEQEVPDLVPYVLGIIMVESGGNAESTPDIMQASESQGWPMNTINNPKDSIHYGVMYLKGAFEDAKEYGIDNLNAIVQSYNFGRGYIQWLATSSREHSLETADDYSRTIVAPSLGNTNGNTVPYSQPIAIAYNGGYRYLNGGNFFYAEIVRQYLSFNGELPDGSELFKAVMSEALKYEGNPYVWGGKSPQQGFDCSGLTYWSYKMAGVNIPLSAAAQYDFTTPVDIKNAQPGDLIFFKGTYGGPNHISHVGIYIDENTMYDSNSSGIGYHNWSSGYWKQHFAGIRRVQ